jgi:hypothetical protein
MVEALCMLVGLAVPIALLVALILFQRSKGEKGLEALCAGQGLTLVSRERNWTGSPHFFVRNRGDIVYRIRVRAADGQERSGHVKVSGFFEKSFEVRWDG